ncbi:hypothetical protein CCACVL1_01419 [Corchorus capsularis]|uniref:Uncharacterized protein n=1 Tax=Corchorus capsularis TaxID=210143 RepID=A0A1R3KIE9_COCAP|nr:hypothetical protein CCACVL1_01419 [Corchorus capsularis]
MDLQPTNTKGKSSAPNEGRAILVILPYKIQQTESAESDDCLACPISSNLASLTDTW